MTITSDGVSDTFEFELPKIDSSLLVTDVDIAKGKIHLIGTVNVPTSDYEVGDVYEENLGTLVGRRVNVGVNSDNEIEKLSVRKANVVYGVMKYYDKEDGTTDITDKDYFEDQTTKTKYYMTTSATTTIFASQIREVVNGDPLGAEPGDETVFTYAKLVLNSNGTVDCAVVDPDAWDGTIKVADVDGTIVSETTKVNVDFDGYTIEKDGEYVTTADLEEDDIIFYEGNGDEKFAEVYNAVVDGEPSDIDSTSIAIDGEAYKWTYETAAIAGSAKYYDSDNDVYKELDDLGTIDAQKYLKSLDADLGVIAYLDRLGDIAYIEGVVEESAVTTDTWYVATSNGEGYTQALSDYLKFKVSDGTEQTIEIPVSQLKKFNGVKIKKITGAGADGANFNFTFTTDETGAGWPFTGAAIDAENLIISGDFVKLTRDEDGKVIGITIATPDLEQVATIDGDNNALKPGVAKVVTTVGTKAKLTDETVIWVYSTKAENDKKTVTKETFADYTRTTEKVNDLRLAGIGPFVLVKGASVTDVLLNETVTAGDSDTFVAGEETTVEGIITGYTTKLNSDGDANYVNTVTIMNISGNKVTYDALDETLAVTDAGKNTYAVLVLDKATGDVSRVDLLESGWTDGSELGDQKTGCTSTQIATLDDDVIKLDSTALVLKKSGTTYSAVKLNQIATSDKPMSIVWHDENYNTTDDVHYADFLVVEELGTAAAVKATAREATLVAIKAANAAFDALDGTTTAWTTYTTKDGEADALITTYQSAPISGSTADFGAAYVKFAANALVPGTTPFSLALEYTSDTALGMDGTFDVATAAGTITAKAINGSSIATAPTWSIKTGSEFATLAGGSINGAGVLTWTAADDADETTLVATLGTVTAEFTLTVETAYATDALIIATIDDLTVTASGSTPTAAEIKTAVEATTEYAALKGTWTVTASNITGSGSDFTATLTWDYTGDGEDIVVDGVEVTI